MLHGNPPVCVKTQLRAHLGSVRVQFPDPVRYLWADGSLKPRIVENNWRDIPAIGARLLARGIAGKAVFHIPQN